MLALLAKKFLVLLGRIELPSPASEASTLSVKLQKLSPNFSFSKLH